MKKLLLAAAIAALPFHAIAAEAPVITKPGPTSSLTINDCLQILQGLNTIDQHVVLIGDAPRQQAVAQSYEYKPDFRINVLAHNIHILTTIQQDAQAEQKRIEREFIAKLPAKDGKPATEIPAGTSEAYDYDRRMRELTSAPCLADLTHFKVEDLNLEKNPVPGWALANLEKIRDK